MCSLGSSWSSSGAAVFFTAFIHIHGQFFHVSPTNLEISWVHCRCGIFISPIRRFVLFMWTRFVFHGQTRSLRQKNWIFVSHRRAPWNKGCFSIQVYNNALQKLSRRGYITWKTSFSGGLEKNFYSVHVPYFSTYLFLSGWESQARTWLLIENSGQHFGLQSPWQLMLVPSLKNIFAASPASFGFEGSSTTKPIVVWLATFPTTCKQ